MSVSWWWCVFLQHADHFKRPAGKRREAQHEYGVDYEEVTRLSLSSHLLLMVSRRCFCSVLQGWIHSCFLRRAERWKARGCRHCVQEVMAVAVITCPLKMRFVLFFSLEINTSCSTPPHPGFSGTLLNEWITHPVSYMMLKLLRQNKSLPSTFITGI